MTLFLVVARVVGDELVHVGPAVRRDGRSSRRAA